MCQLFYVAIINYSPFLTPHKDKMCECQTHGPLCIDSCFSAIVVVIIIYQTSVPIIAEQFSSIVRIAIGIS